MAWVVGVALLVALILVAQAVWKFLAWFLRLSATPSMSGGSNYSFGHLPEPGGPVGPLGGIRPDGALGSPDDPEGLVGG